MSKTPLPPRPRVSHLTGALGRLLPVLLLAAGAPATRGQPTSGQPGPGLFESHGDVGAVHLAGAVDYDAAHGTYLVTGGGENMWFGTDAFHFVWKRASGDVSFAADLRWIGTGGNAHRKACLIIRQSLDADSPYVDAVVHGNGLTSIQWREARGDVTHEVQANLSAPRRIGLEKQGDTVFMLAGGDGAPLQTTGGSFRLKLTEPFYVGLGVCAHDNNVVEKAVFSDVALRTGAPASSGEPVLESTLEIVPIASGDRRVVYHARDHIEAPNWSRDGQTLLFNRDGRLYHLPVAGGVPQPIDTGFATRCNNDHGLSPDGRWLAISDQSQDGKSVIYVLPADGGTPRRITALAPSYWHGWSPDGRTLAYCGERAGNFDIYAITVDGGTEQRLTTAVGLDDGPDYSPDGQSIYFNSDRTGRMQIWRMKPDGSGQEQITSDDYNNWFAHPSPDGRWIVFLSYEKDVQGHPANKDVMLRLMPTAGGEIRVLAKLFGGQGTINVPSWSPDSTQLAFVSYQLIHP
ncbi:MAG TPA: TolB family protein [Opitutaceae bacterium]|nr:TolB family protein [Opitutaceae bacterium]